jgi:hypothetical protein
MCSIESAPREEITNNGKAGTDRSCGFATMLSLLLWGARSMLWKPCFGQHNHDEISEKCCGR